MSEEKQLPPMPPKGTMTIFVSCNVCKTTMGRARKTPINGPIEFIEAFIGFEREHSQCALKKFQEQKEVANEDTKS